jgi:hypothetical protein
MAATMTEPALTTPPPPVTSAVENTAPGLVVVVELMGEKSSTLTKVFRKVELRESRPSRPKVGSSRATQHAVAASPSTAQDRHLVHHHMHR